MGGGGVTPANKQNHSLVFYSEGKQYHNVFKPILEYLDYISYSYTYLTSSKEDLDLFINNKDSNTKHINPNAQFEYIGSSDSSKAIARLNTLKADIVMMSTPQLHVLQIKRSKGVKHYIHIIHSLPHVDIYEVFALDYFDSVFTNSNIHTDFIRKVEQVRNLPRKHIAITGCTYLDVLQKKLNAYKSLDKDKKIDFFATNTTQSKIFTILLAPTWGREALLSKYGMKLISPFINSSFNLIIRPHPQSYISESKMLTSLKEQTKDCKNIVWDSNRDNIYALDYADMMIGDFSGVLFDFICLFEKPVLTAKFNFNIAGYDLEDIYTTPWVKDALTKIGKSIEPNDFSRLPDIVSAFLQDKDGYNKMQDSIRQMKALLWEYQGLGGIESAKEILKIHREILLSNLNDKLALHHNINAIEKALQNIKEFDTKNNITSKTNETNEINTVNKNTESSMAKGDNNPTNKTNEVSKKNKNIESNLINLINEAKENNEISETIRANKINTINERKNNDKAITASKSIESNNSNTTTTNQTQSIKSQIKTI